MTLVQEVERRGLRLEKLTKYRSTNMGYEVFAPDGFRFTDGCHSFVRYDAKDVRDLLKDHLTIERCPADCDCREVEA